MEERIEGIGVDERIIGGVGSGDENRRKNRNWRRGCER